MINLHIFNFILIVIMATVIKAIIFFIAFDVIVIMVIFDNYLVLIAFDVIVVMVSFGNYLVFIRVYIRYALEACYFML